MRLLSEFDPVMDRARYDQIDEVRRLFLLAAAQLDAGIVNPALAVWVKNLALDAALAQIYKESGDGRYYYGHDIGWVASHGNHHNLWAYQMEGIAAELDEMNPNASGTFKLASDLMYAMSMPPQDEYHAIGFQLDRVLQAYIALGEDLNLVLST